MTRVCLASSDPFSGHLGPPLTTRMTSATAHGRRKTRVETSLALSFSKLEFAALRVTITARCRAEDDEQFRREAKPSIVLNEGGHDRQERRLADAGSESRLVAARRVGRGRALANGTRGEEDLRPRSLLWFREN